MKYAIQPVLKEIETYVEDLGWDQYHPECVGEVLQQSDDTFELAAESAELLVKIYHANKGA